MPLKAAATKVRTALTSSRRKKVAEQNQNLFKNPRGPGGGAGPHLLQVASCRDACTSQTEDEA